MKKYNLSEIMKEAWNSYRKCGSNDFAAALRSAWKAAKAKALNDIVAVVKTVFNRRATVAVGTSWGEVCDFRATLWENYGKRRIYLEDTNTEKAYIDLADRSVHIITSRMGLVKTAVANFINSFEF